MQEGMAQYLADFPGKPVEKLFGYTSWYNYYQNINEEIILRDLNALDSRFNLFQIDDGYETFVGDWLDVDTAKFPNGLKPILDNIHNRGFKAGLWLAPFVAEEKSKLFKEHNDWIKRDSKGKLVKSGGNWSGHYALDLDKQEVMSEDLTHYHLICTMQLKLEDIVVAREKLEAVGLLRSYFKKEEVQQYVYMLYSPILPQEFFNHPILNIVLYNNLGKKEYEKVLSYFKVPAISLKDYQEVTAAFDEVFSPTLGNIKELEEDVSDKHSNSLIFKNKIDLCIKNREAILEDYKRFREKNL